jgi:hypothetical protein
MQEVLGAGISFWWRLESERGWRFSPSSLRGGAALWVVKASCVNKSDVIPAQAGIHLEMAPQPRGGAD